VRLLIRFRAPAGCMLRKHKEEETVRVPAWEGGREGGRGGKDTTRGVRTYFLRAAGWLRSLLVLRGMALRREAYGMILNVVA